MGMIGRGSDAPKMPIPKTLPDTKGIGDADNLRRKQALGMTGLTNSTILTNPLGIGSGNSTPTLLGS